MDKSAEARVLAEVDVEQIWHHTEIISQWVRLSGSPEERRAFDYLAQVLRGCGLEVRSYEFDSLVSFPGEASFEVLSPESRRLPCLTHSFALSTPPGGVEGELVYLGRGGAGEYQGKEVVGKIALIEGYGLAMATRARTAEERGVRAQVFLHDEHLHEMALSSVWGTPTPETAPLLPHTPAVSLTRGDGAYLKELLGRGAVRVRFQAQVWTGWKRLPVLVAEVKGNREPHFVLFSGHVDSWHYGAMDNGSANATALEMARLFSRHRGLLRRGLRLAFWSGHSHGRYSGSAWYADHFWEELHGHCVAHVNIDSPGAQGASDLTKALSMAETRPLAAGVIQELTGQKLEARKIGRAGDQSFWGCGVPSVFMSLSEQPTGGLGWWWHTPQDTLDKLDRDNLLRDAKVYALTLLRLCSSPVLPLDYSAGAQEFLDSLTQLQHTAGAAFDLQPCIRQAREFQAEAQALHRAIGGVGARAKGKIEVANQALMALGRALIPAYHCRADPFDHDLAAPLPPLPRLQGVTQLASLNPESDQFRFLYTRLVREANKVRHALTQATHLAHQARQRLGAGTQKG